MTTMLTDDLNEPDDVVVQLLQLFGRDPPLGVMIPTYLLNLIASHEGAADRKARTYPTPSSLTFHRLAISAAYL